MKIIIPGKPIAQQRHRHTVSVKGKVWAYNPLAREKAITKQHIAALMMNECPDFTLLKIADISFKFYMPIPKYLKVKEKKLAKEEELRHIVKPDVDNLCKFYLDCMVKIILTDDNGVKLLGAEKVYSPNPRVEIIITPGEQLLTQDKPQHDSFDSLECAKPNYETIDVPPYSESPHYSNIPQLHDTYAAWKNRAHPSK